jgi:hypothetical protein
MTSGSSWFASWKDRRPTGSRACPHPVARRWIARFSFRASALMRSVCDRTGPRWTPCRHRWRAYGRVLPRNDVARCDVARRCLSGGTNRRSSRRDAETQRRKVKKKRHLSLSPRVRPANDIRPCSDTVRRGSRRGATGRARPPQLLRAFLLFSARDLSFRGYARAIPHLAEAAPVRSPSQQGTAQQPDMPAERFK